MIQKQFIFALSLIVTQLSTKVASAQATFIFDKELAGEGSDDLFGWSVDLSGDGKTIIVGAIANFGALPGQGNVGQARVYRNIYNGIFNFWSWTLLGQEINGTAANGELGKDVSINYDGNIIAIGSPGTERVKVYEYNGTNNWIQQGNDYTLPSNETAQRLGHSVSINGAATVMVIGAPAQSKVWVKDIDPVGNTGSLGYNNPLTMPGTYFGGSVDVDDDGNSIVVGAYKSNTERGLVVVYDLVGLNWVQRGQTLNGVNPYDHFGFDVSMSNDGNTIAIGSRGWDSDPATTDSIGEAAVYDWDGTNWVQRGTSIQGANNSDQCGYAVSLTANGNRIAIGYRGNSTFEPSAGMVRIFDWDGSAWVPNGVPIYGDDDNILSGHSVALSDNGSVLAIGAIQGSGTPNQWTSQEGHVHIYEGDCMVSTMAVTQNNDTLTAVANGTYQWLDCNNGNQPILNATGQIFVAQNSGSYSVQITENGCTQTSNCMQVLVTSVNAVTSVNFLVYPNPTTNIITVNSNQLIQNIYVLDITGKSVLTIKNSNRADLSGLSHGLYHLALQFENGGIGHVKIQKQ
jgi:hypothetical protein